jgi:uncharacterized membrane protein YgcG
MKATVRLVLLGMGISLVTGLAAVASWAQEGYSHVRIVRLSFAEGVVTVQRPDVAEWAMAPANTPIQEGFKLSTAESGYAEVEFENSSTARLGQLSLLEFAQLALMPSGGKVNRMTLHQGYATFTVIPEGGDFYEVKAGSATLTPHDRCRFRVDYDQGMVQVKVFKGSVEILSPEGTGTLGQNTVLLIRPGADEPFEISQGISKDAWDEWVEERENRMQLAHNHAGPAPYSAAIPDLLYGWMDLMSYGSWYSFPGYGWGWVPMVDYGWAPFTMGRWCWYPGSGYAWISGEPWGWLPYHYGTWFYQPGFGWCWLPGNFGYWSPGVVNWYQGPGWVGWAPRSPVAGGRQTNCPEAQGCVTAVDPETVRRGLPVHPNRLGGNFGYGQLVERPDLSPDRLGMLPGSPQAQAGAFRGGQGAEAYGQPGRLAPGAAPEGRGSAGGIVYDPEQRRYVNGPGQGAAPETRAAPAAQTQGATGSSARAGRPGPRENYPEPAVSGSFGAPAGVEERSLSPRSGSRPAPQGSRATGDSGESPSSSTWRDSARSDESSSSRASSSRSAPSASPRSDSGSRSSGMSSGSSRGGSSGGGSSSHGSGGGYSGGSSGASHSSGSSGGGRGSGGSSGSHSSTGPRN